MSKVQAWRGCVDGHSSHLHFLTTRSIDVQAAVYVDLRGREMATNRNLSPSMRRHSSNMSSRRPSHGAFDGASPIMTTADANMPVRHSRPLTAAELHLELEKEQEAVVCPAFLCLP